MVYDTQPRLFICIPAHPKPAKYVPEYQGHGTIEEVPFDQSWPDQSKLVSNVPDFP